ncbi:hypothetical protein Hanom_Chr02g00106001 [Helianthus anomalus]
MMLRWSPTTDKRSRRAATTKSLLSVFGFIAIRLSIGLLGSFAFGRWLLLKFPLIFTFGGFIAMRLPLNHSDLRLPLIHSEVLNH